MFPTTVPLAAVTIVTAYAVVLLLNTDTSDALSTVEAVPVPVGAAPVVPSTLNLIDFSYALRVFSLVAI
jgi:hypothetical protein